MAEVMQETERCELARRVGAGRSGVFLSAWTVAALNEGVNPPETESQRFQLCEGMSFILELLAGRLSELYGKLNEE